MSLIAFEGIDGTGKSTQARLLEERVRAGAPPWASGGVVRAAEPTTSVHGQEIRAIMDRGGERLPFDRELALFIEDRKWNVEHVIRPALHKGAIVILDRYYFSTAAYQGSRGVLPHGKILAMNEAFAPEPSLLFLFFMDNIDDALHRIDADAGRHARSYMERKDNLERVQAIFKAIHESGRYRSVAIDACRPAAEIHATVWSAVETYFSNAPPSKPW